jgi:hypothetical protein
MKDFDLRKYLAEGRLLKEEIMVDTTVMVDPNNTLMSNAPDEEIDYIKANITNVHKMSVEDFQERYDEYFNRFYGEGDPLDLQIKALQIHIDKGVLTREEAIEALAMLQGQDVEEFEDMFLDVNKILSDGGYDEIDDEKLLIKVQNHPEFNSNIDAKELNFLVMKIEDEEGGNIDFSEGKLLKEEKRSVVDYDNRDDRTTELFLDNGDSVEVDVIELYDNLKENNPTDVAGEIIELIRSTGVDPSDMMDAIGEEYGISFEFGRG